MGQSRRSHTKSRNGCKECKTKKIKCDEQVPCGRCSKLSLACSLSTESTASINPPLHSLASKSIDSSSPSTSVDTFEASDFALFNHFLTTTLPCLALKNEALLMSWKSDLPNLAPKFPYLLHEVLAVSAIHLYHLNPGSSINYQRVAWGHQAKAFSQFRDALSPEVAEHQVHALFACSALMSNYYFASFEDPSSLLFNSDPPGPPEWIFPVRGCATLVRQLRGPLEASTSWTALQSSLDTWSVSPPSPGGPEWEPELQLMEAKLSKLSVLSHGTDPRPLYEEDFQLLRECFKIAGKAGDASCKVSAMMFGGAASGEFLKDMTERKRPETLVMMAFWCVLISRVNQRHWLRSESVPEAILGVIEAPHSVVPVRSSLSVAHPRVAAFKRKRDACLG